MRAYAALWRPYNDIDIYVEDSSLKGLYERLFRRLLNESTRLSALIPLSNRAAILEEARRLRQDRTRIRFFLVDGDFFWSVGARTRIPNLYVLPCYSIENFAWHLPSIKGAAETVAPHMSAIDIDAGLQADELDAIANCLVPVFIAYAISFRLGGSCETVKFSVTRLVQDGTRSSLCPKKIRSRTRAIFRHLREEFGLDAVRRERQTTISLLQSREVIPSRFVAGKDYLLGILLSIFHERFGFRGNSRQLLSLILSKGTPLEVKLKAALRRAVRPLS